MREKANGRSFRSEVKDQALPPAETEIKRVRKIDINRVKREWR
jgi:hypothetical protein